MSDIVLHHYPGSPFSEKVRAMLGWKGLAWKSVVTPSIAPKPDLTALTGGYRKAPVCQVGRDVYCDTRRIADLLDELAPDPPLLTSARALGDVAACEWLDSTFFFVCVALALQPKAFAHFASVLPPAEAAGFLSDRAKFMEGARIVRFSVPDAEAAFEGVTARLDAQLANAPFLGGGQPSALDFSAYHPIWFASSNAVARAYVDRVARVSAWRDRMQALAREPAAEISGDQALSICRAAPAASDGPHAAAVGEVGSEGLEVGQPVEIVPTDYGFDPVRGELVLASAREVVVRRTDPRAGEVRVHFPRSGFAVSRIP